MKKIFSLLLVTVLLLGLCACGGDSENADGGKNAGSGKFEVGFGKVNIMPDELGVPMNGYSDPTERLSTGFLSYIYAISIAIRDPEGNVAVMMSVDSASIGRIGEEVRTWASSTYGFPRENMLVSAIHQHSCPDPYIEDWPTSVRYRTKITQGMKDSVTLAIEDLAPAEVYINTATTEALSFVRHYLMNDGTYCGDNFGSEASGYKGHESESDKEMRMVKFTREGDKKDIIVVNFQAHPHIGTTGDATDIHADWPGVMRDEVSKALGCETMYFSGAGGNLNSHSRIYAENITDISREMPHIAHGKRAAQYVIDAESTYTKVESGKVVAKEVTIQYDADHSMDDLYEKALEVHEARSTSSAAAYKALEKYYPDELHSIYHASAVVEKYNAGPHVEMKIGAITFGDVAFTYHPYEMFDENGMELRAGSANHINKDNYDADDQLENPYKMTMITTMSNGAICYVPSHRGYTNGGYSTDITKVAPGTGEQLVGDYLRILDELHD